MTTRFITSNHYEDGASLNEVTFYGCDASDPPEYIVIGGRQGGKSAASQSSGSSPPRKIHPSRSKLKAERDAREDERMRQLQAVLDDRSDGIIIYDSSTFDVGSVHNKANFWGKTGKNVDAGAVPDEDVEPCAQTASRAGAPTPGLTAKSNGQAGALTASERLPATKAPHDLTPELSARAQTVTAPGPPDAASNIQPRNDEEPTHKNVPHAAHTSPEASETPATLGTMTGAPTANLYHAPPGPALVEPPKRSWGHRAMVRVKGAFKKPSDSPDLPTEI